MIRNDVDGQLAVNANMARSTNPAALWPAWRRWCCAVVGFTGICLHAKIPKNPELTLNPGTGDVDTRVKRVVCALIQRVIVWGN